MMTIVERGNRVSELSDVEGTRFCGGRFYGSRRSKAWREFKAALDALAEKYGAVFSNIATRNNFWTVTYYLVPPLDANYPAFKTQADKLSAMNPIPAGVDVFAYDKALDEGEEDEDEDDESES